MYREVNQRKFSKATLARLGSVMLLLVFAVPHLTVVAEEVTYSKLWGRSGELWSPTSRLPDFSYAGYSRGEHPLRELKADVSVKQFGAIGDGETDDTNAFKKAIEQSPGKTILVPAGRYRITDFLYIKHSGTSLLGESPVKSILFFPTPLHTIKPNMGATTTGQPTSNYSWSGGFVYVTGSSSGCVGRSDLPDQARAAVAVRLEARGIHSWARRAIEPARYRAAESGEVSLHRRSGFDHKPQVACPCIVPVSYHENRHGRQGYRIRSPPAVGRSAPVEAPFVRCILQRRGRRHPESLLRVPGHTVQRALYGTRLQRHCDAQR